MSCTLMSIYLCFGRILVPLGLLKLKMKALGDFETAVAIYNLRDGDVIPLKTCVFDSRLVIVPLR